MINAISHRLSDSTLSHSISNASAHSSAPLACPIAPKSSPETSPSNVSKEKIATNFGQSAHTYQAQAHLQRQCAHTLLDFLDKEHGQQGSNLPDGPVLEIGCGTGFITQHLIDRFLSSHLRIPRHPLQVTDLSAEMVAFCQRQVSLPMAVNPPSGPAESHGSAPISFYGLDAESGQAPSQTYSLIIGGFVAQWFKHLAHTVDQLLDQLKPGGRLLLSFPGHQSFPEWREWCDRLQLPYTAHPLPNPHDLIQQLRLSADQYTLRVEMCPTYYDSAKSFFKSMKVIGAGASDAGQCLSPTQMRQLLRAWQPSGDCNTTRPRLKVHYEVVYLAIWKR